MNVSELDSYRAGYRAGMPYSEHRVFYDRLALEHPEQNYYSLTLAREFFQWCEPDTVLELGGWDGGLAAEILPDSGIRSWLNYEIAKVPQVCTDLRYTRIVATNWLWELKLRPADAFVASHSLEHLTAEHLDMLLWALDAKFAYVDVPLFDVPHDWNGSSTTHALELSIVQFDEMWAWHGWTIEQNFFRDGDIPSHVRFLRQ